MKTNLKLAGEPPPRQTLAEAIAAAAEAKHREASARDAVQRARDMAEQAATKLEAASTDAAKVKGAQAHRVAEAATNGTPLTPDRSMRDARSREVDAQDELGVAQDALATVEAAYVDAENMHREAGERLDAAVRGVLAPAALRILDELTKLQVEVAEKRILLWGLAREFLGENDGRTVSDVLGRPFLLAEINGPIKPPPAWHAAREALRQNADAPLPV